MRPAMHIEFHNPEMFRKLNTEIDPGCMRELYSGIEIYNVGKYPINITIRTPRTAMYEKMQEEFFADSTPLPNTKVVKEHKPTVILGNVLTGETK
jgi:hypothetical protein